jgi:tol-pal system protein YbgF
VFPILIAFLFFSVVVAPSLHSQNSVPPIPTTVIEEQDFAFAYGLYKDNLYQQGLEQFEQFVERYPASSRKSEAEFFAIECQYHLERYEAAEKALTRYVQNYPSTQLTDDAYFRLGETQLKLKKIPDAIASFKTVLDKFGDRELAGEAAYWIGESSVRTEEYDTALKYYTLAYEYPKNRLRDYAVYSVAWTYQKKKDYTNAVDWYEKLVAEFPQSSLVSASRVRVGESYYYVKDYQKAIAYLTAARPSMSESQEQSEADYLIAEAFYNLENYTEAQQRYESFLASYAGNKLEREVLYDLGWSLMKQQKFTQAADVFGKLTSGNDQLAHAGLYRKGTALRLSGDRTAALQVFKDVVLKSPQGEFSDNALYDAGMVLYEDKDYAGARKYFEQSYTSYPGSDVLAETYRMAAECWVTESAFQQAFDLFEKALSQPNAPTDVKSAAGYQAAWCLYKLKKYREAASRFGAYLQAFPKHPQATDASYWWGEALYHLADYKGALTAYQPVANLPSHERKEEAWYGIAWSHYKQSDFEKARAAFEQLLASFPSGRFVFDARVRVGDCYYFTKDYSKAIAAYRTVIRQFAQHDGIDYAIYQLGQSYYRGGDLPSASQQFTAILQSYPKSTFADDAQYALGWMYFQRKEYTDAIKEFQKVISSYPSSDVVPRSLYSIGDSYYNLQKYQEAEKAYRDLLSRYPKSLFVSDALSGVQYSLIAQGKQQEAAQAVDKFMEANPDAASAEELVLKKADLLYNQKQYAEAAAEFRSFSAKYPKSKLLATALYWNGKCLQALARLAEAATMFERAAGSPGVSEKIGSGSLAEAGTIYFRQKQYDQALGIFSKIESSYPESDAAADASYLKGMIFWENGDSQEAKNQFEFVVKKRPSTDGAARSKVALARLAQKFGDPVSAQRLAKEVATARNDAIGAEAQYVSASVFADQKDWQNAATAFYRVRYVYPSFEEWVTKAYLGLGIAYENLNDVPKAKEAYQNVLRIKKDDQAVAEAERRLKELERL